MVQGLNPSRGRKEILLFSKTIQTNSGDHPELVPGFFPWLKQLGCEVDHSSTSSANFKNEWNYSFASPVCHCGVDKDNCTVLLQTILRKSQLLTWLTTFTLRLWILIIISVLYSKPVLRGHHKGWPSIHQLEMSSNCGVHLSLFIRMSTFLSQVPCCFLEWKPKYFTEGFKCVGCCIIRSCTLRADWWLQKYRIL
jgi:hypothetical protein